MGIFRKKSGRRGRRGGKRRVARLRRQMIAKVKRVFVVAVLLLVAGGVIFAGIRGVLRVKQGSSDIEEGQEMVAQIEGEVLGLQGIPIYPGSKFMYDGHVEEDLVQEFLSEQKSVYRLPADTEWDEVVDFYEKTLAEEGWEHVLSVDFGDDDRKPGEYWVKSAVLDETESGEGLRIYYRVNDVWFEKITEQQARNGLSDVVAQEKQIEFLLEMSSAEELPKSFPWKLKYPPQWDVEIKKSRLMEIEYAEFVDGDSDAKVVIEPIDFSSMQPMEEVAAAFIDEVNSRRGEGEQLVVVSQEGAKVAGKDAVKFNFESGSMYVVTHSGNGVIYAVTDFDGEMAFIEYVVKNLEAR